jgi:dihydrofolate reductase
MRKVVAYEYVTLDGVMEAPEKWQFPYLTDDVAELIKAQILEADAVLLGRITYDIFAASWPSRTNNEFGVADKLNTMPKFVASRTLQRAEWHNSTLIKGDVAKEVAELKQQPGGNIAIIGSGKLVGALMQHALIDEYRLMIYPVVLGSGQRLFPDGIHAALRLIEARTFSSGVVLLRYQPAA